MGRFGYLLLVIAGWAGTAGAVASTHPHARDGFLLGFQIGAGVAVFDAEGATERAGSVAGGAGGLTLGYAVSPSWTLAAEWNGWNNESFGVKQSLSFTSFAFAWYPRSGGFYLEGSVGWARGRYRQSLADGGRDVDTDGPGIGVAVGYEWRLTRTFALSTGLDLLYGDLDGADASSANLILGFRWFL